MIKRITPIIIHIIFSSVLYGQTFYNQKIESAAMEIAQKIMAAEKNSVTVLDFRNSDNRVSELGNWFANIFSTYLENNSIKRFTVKNQKDEQITIRQIGTENKSGAYDSKIDQNLGEIPGSDVIIYGEITLLENVITINIRAKSSSLKSSIGGTIVSFTVSEDLQRKYNNYLDFYNTPNSTNAIRTNNNSVKTNVGTQAMVQSNCYEKRTGDYYFHNNTRYPLTVYLSSYRNIGEFVLAIEPGKNKKFTNLKEGVKYYVIKSRDNSHIGYGKINVEACKEKNFLIK